MGKVQEGKITGDPTTPIAPPARDAGERYSLTDHLCRTTARGALSIADEGLSHDQSVSLVIVRELA